MIPDFSPALLSATKVFVNMRILAAAGIFTVLRLK